MGDVYMVNGKILSGLPNHAKDIIFEKDGTTLNSTNTEDAIKEVNSNLTDLTKKVFGTSIDLKNYTASSPYLTTTDGYVTIGNNSSVSASAFARIKYGTLSIVPGKTNWSQYEFTSVYVKKGAYLNADTTDVNGIVTFLPLI